jgi:hypothetical protein
LCERRSLRPLLLRLNNERRDLRIGAHPVDDET